MFDGKEYVYAVYEEKSFSKASDFGLSQGYQVEGSSSFKEI